MYRGFFIREGNSNKHNLYHALNLWGISGHPLIQGVIYDAIILESGYTLAMK